MTTPARHYGLTPAQFKQLPLADRISLIDAFRDQQPEPMTFFVNIDHAALAAEADLIRFTNAEQMAAASSPVTDHSAAGTDTEGVSILIDTETLGLKPGSVITSIAAIAFNRRDLTVIDHLEIIPDFFEQLSIGRTFDPETLAFHRRNKTLPRTDSGEETPCIEAVVNLAAFIRHHQPHRIWIQGPDFDRPLLEDLCKAFNQPLPWHYTKSRDARTAYDIAFPGRKHPKRPHKALEDCQETLVDLAEALAELGRLHTI